MDPILQVLLSWQFVVFSLAVAAVMYVLRIAVEYVMNSFNIDPSKPKWWNDLLLPILPVVIGTVSAAYLKTFPYPDGLTTRGSRIVFGLVAGLLSTLLYRVFKALLFQKVEAVVQSLPGTSAAPPSLTSEAPSDTTLPPRGTL